MPWRRPRKKVDRPVNVSRAIEETLEELSRDEDDDDSVELADVDGASIVEAATGEAAMEIARAERPDMVIADILMPSMDGYELVRELRGDPTTANVTAIWLWALLPPLLLVLVGLVATRRSLKRNAIARAPSGSNSSAWPGTSFQQADASGNDQD